MPSSYTEHGLTKQNPGENENAWGDILNENVFELIDDGIFGRAAFTLSGSKTLTNTNGVVSEARNAILEVTGGTGGTITIPTLSKLYVVINGASDTVELTAGGASAVVQPGQAAQVVCNGTDVHLVQPRDFGSQKITGVANPTDPQDVATRAYVDAQVFEAAAGNLPGQLGSAGKFLTTDGDTAFWAAPTVAQVTGAAPLAAPSFTGGITAAGGFSLGGGGTISGGLTLTGSSKANVQALAALDCDLSAADFFTKSISANSAITFSNATASKAQVFIIELTISSAAVPSWPASVKWGGGVNPSSALGNGRHVLGFVTFDGGTTWTGFLGAVAAA